VAQGRERPNADNLGRRGRLVVPFGAWVAADACREGQETKAPGPGIAWRWAAMPVECSAGWGGRGLCSSERRERGVTGRWQVGREGDRVGGSSPVGKIRKYSDFSFNLFHHGNEK
jgi:hypothetical protein